MAIDLTVGLNTYVSLVEADAYFNGRIYSDEWTKETDSDRKAKVLITATNRVDRLHLKGVKASSSQSLAFPRYPDTEIQQRVKNAVCEEAFALLKGIPKRIELQEQGVESFSLGSLSENYTGRKLKLLSPEARELLRPYMVGSVTIC